MWVLSVPFIFMFVLFSLLMWLDDGIKGDDDWYILCSSCEEKFYFNQKDLYRKDAFCGGIRIGAKNELYAKCTNCKDEVAVFEIKKGK